MGKELLKVMCPAVSETASELMALKCQLGFGLSFCFVLLFSFKIRVVLDEVG